jgi:cyclopropane fatty-acyl-phospholipid synthase-like methyltransferase
VRVSASRLAAAIVALVRAHAANTPRPRGLPWLGLEHASGTGFHLLDALAERGIFRKYEHVLDLGGGLGATSRWLAARLGCEVVATADSADEAAAAAELTRRAGLAAQVRSLPATPAALPFRAGRFTHVWIVEALPRMRDAEAALAEAQRALRPGGTLAIQDLVSDDHAPVPALPPSWRPAPLAHRLDTLARLGFVDVTTRDRSHEAAERAAQVQAARQRLLERGREDDALAPLLAERESVAAALAAGTLRVVQILARRA